jgi:hypothetical protein
MAWGRRLYFPSAGRRAADFIALKNPSPLATFEPINLGSSGKHANYYATGDDRLVTLVSANIHSNLNQVASRNFISIEYILAHY